MVCRKRNILNICIVVVFGMITRGTWSQTTNLTSRGIEREQVYGPTFEEPIHCFQCNSWEQAGCSVINPPYGPNHPLLKLCSYRPGAKPHCQKVVEKRMEFNRDLVIRRCAWAMQPPPDCKIEKFSGGSEISCQCFHNACNSAPSFPHLASLATVVVGLLVFVGFGGQ